MRKKDPSYVERSWEVFADLNGDWPDDVADGIDTSASTVVINGETFRARWGSQGTQIPKAWVDILLSGGILIWENGGIARSLWLYLIDTSDSLQPCSTVGLILLGVPEQYEIGGKVIWHQADRRHGKKIGMYRYETGVWTDFNQQREKDSKGELLPPVIWFFREGAYFDTKEKLRKALANDDEAFFLLTVAKECGRPGSVIDQSKQLG